MERTRQVVGLAYLLAKTNFKLRNEGSYLGLFWYLLEPLAFFVILLFVGKAISSTYIAQYPVYLFIGLMVFNFFQSTTAFSTSVIRNNSGFIKSMKIEKEAFVLSGLFQFTFSHLFEYFILIGFVLYFGMNVLWALLYPLVFVFLFFFAAGVCFALATIGAYVNDLKNVWAVFVRLLWFVTPIFYVISDDSLRLHAVQMLNPLYHFINISRDLIILHRVPLASTVCLAAIAVAAVFVGGIRVFDRNEDRMAERV